MRAELIVNPFTNSFICIIIRRFLHFLSFFLLSVIMWYVGRLQQCALIFNPLNPRIVPLRNSVTAPNLHASWAQTLLRAGRQSRAVHSSGSWSLSATPALCFSAATRLFHHRQSPWACSGAFPHAEELKHWTPAFYLQAFHEMGLVSRTGLDAKCPPNCSITAFVSWTQKGDKIEWKKVHRSR